MMFKIFNMLILSLWVSHAIGAISPVGKVVEVSGKVSELGLLREQQKTILKLHEDLFIEDLISTGEASTARLILSHENPEKIGLFLYENSQLKILKSLTKKMTEARLTEGLLRAFIRGLQKGETFLIRVPNGVIGVRGTRLEVSTVSHQTSVLVDEGDAVWLKLTTDPGAPDWSTSRPLERGTRYQFDSNGNLMDRVRGSLLNVDNHLQRLPVSSMLGKLSDSKAFDQPHPDPGGQAGYKGQMADIEKGLGRDGAMNGIDNSQASGEEDADTAVKPGFPAAP